MLLSLYTFQSCLIRYNKHEEKRRKKENYSVISDNLDMESRIHRSMYGLSLIFVMLELTILYYAIRIAILCSKSRVEKIVHVILAVLFTLPYMVFSVFLTECAPKVLRGNSETMPLLENDQKVI